MHEILPETEGAFVAVRVTDRIDAEDFKAIASTLERAIGEHGKARLFWEMRDFHGWTASGLWADTKFDLRHANGFSRISMVGEANWHEWMTKLMKPFTSAELKYFEIQHRDSGMAWAEKTDLP